MLQEKDKSTHVVGSVTAPQRYPHPRAPSQMIVTFHGQGDLAVWLRILRWQDYLGLPGEPIVITSIFVRGRFDSTKGQGIVIMGAGIGEMLPGAEECPQPLDMEEVGNVFCLGVSRSSVGKESACNVKRPWFNSWIGKIHWRRDRLPTPVFLGFSGGSAGKESACNAGDLDSIPGLGRSPGEGKGYPL